MICVAAAGALLALAADTFTLSWTHSVAHTLWEERWEAGPAGLRPVEATIEGTGAGMEIPEDAVRTERGWSYHPSVPPLPEVWLAASGTTGGGWRFCAAGTCRELGVEAGDPIRLWQAERCEAVPRR